LAIGRKQEGAIQNFRQKPPPVVLDIRPRPDEPLSVSMARRAAAQATALGVRFKDPPYIRPIKLERRTPPIARGSMTLEPTWRAS
jgi:hypothetical protein